MSSVLTLSLSYNVISLLVENVPRVIVTRFRSCNRSRSDYTGERTIEFAVRIADSGMMLWSMLRRRWARDEVEEEVSQHEVFRKLLQAHLAAAAGASGERKINFQMSLFLLLSLRPYDHKSVSIINTMYLSLFRLWSFHRSPETLAYAISYNSCKYYLSLHTKLMFCTVKVDKYFVKRGAIYEIFFNFVFPSFFHFNILQFTSPSISVFFFGCCSIER